MIEPTPEERRQTIVEWVNRRSKSQGVLTAGMTHVTKKLMDFVHHKNIGFGRNNLHPGVAGQHQVYRLLMVAGCESKTAQILADLTPEEVCAEEELRGKMLDDGHDPDDWYDRMMYQTLYIDAPLFFGHMDALFARCSVRI